MKMPSAQIQIRWSLAAAAAAAAALCQAQAPPVPRGLVSQGDDRVATLSWNGWFRPGWEQPQGVTGYVVEWRRSQTTDPIQRKTVILPTTQLQPLVNGTSYIARVMAISATGRLSAPTSWITVRSDHRRVAALRQQMNGFFDDFNRPAGLPDMHAWSASYSQMNCVCCNGFFINDQFHAHNMGSVSSPFARGFSAARPRRTFNIAGRTGTIVFDLDGSAQNEDAWYLDLVPQRMDMTGRANLDVHDPEGQVSDSQSIPPNSLRFLLNGDTVSILWFDAAGRHTVMARGSLEARGIRLVPNVRRPFRVRVSQSTAELMVDGQVIASTSSLSIPWTRAHLIWSGFQYESKGKWNTPKLMMHWDNFGFDAPPGEQQPAVRSWRPDLHPGAEAVWSEGFQPAGNNIQIGSTLAGAIGARIMFSRQAPEGYAADSSPEDAVYINGARFAIPAARGPYGIEHHAAQGDSIEIPLSVLRQGMNQVAFRAAAAGFSNYHIEVDYPPAAAPSPVILHPAPRMETKPFGPNVIIANWGDDWNSISESIFDVSGILNLQVEVNTPVLGPNAAMIANGTDSRLSRLEFMVNRQVVRRISTSAQSPTPSGSYVIPFDTRTLPNGVHEVFVRGFSPEGWESIPDYVHGTARPGSYMPVRLRVAN